MTLISYSIRIADLDIYRSAQVLVKRHGEDAPMEAAMRADAMLDKGDLDGRSRSCSARSLGRVGRCIEPGMRRGFSFVLVLECRLLGVDRTWRGGGRNSWLCR